MVNSEVSEVRLDGDVVGSVFPTRGGKFYFLMDDDRDDKPRGPFHSEADAMQAGELQAHAMKACAFWESMLDT